MTVRESVSIVIRAIPGSDKLPRNIKELLDKTDANSTLLLMDEYEEDVKLTMKSSMTPAQRLRLRMASSRGHVGGPLNPSKEFEYKGDNLSPYSDKSQLESLEEEATLQEFESDYARRSLVDQYLTEQNEKFNSLIHKNLKEVMNQQQQFEEGTSWRRLAFDFFLSKNLPEATERANLLMEKISVTAASYVPALAQKHSPQAFVDEYEAHMAQVHAKRLLETYTAEEKEYVYRELSQEFKQQDIPRCISQDHILGPEPTYLDKVEALLLLSVRLSFASLRHSLPLIQQTANKFKNDEILLFNSSNFNRFLVAIINLLEKIERKVGTNRKASDEGRLTEVANNSDAIFEHSCNDTGINEWSKSMLKLVAGPDYTSSRLMYSLQATGVGTPLEESPTGNIGTLLDVAQRFASEMS